MLQIINLYGNNLFSHFFFLLKVNIIHPEISVATAKGNTDAFEKGVSAFSSKTMMASSNIIILILSTSLKSRCLSTTI